MVCPSCGAPNEDAAQVCFTCRAILAVLTQGSVVGGRYEILALLGRGGMGTVYKVQDRVLHETVALKVLRPEIARRQEMADRFRQEIRLARQVEHPNVCRIHEYGVDDGLSYIAMEWIEGTSLKEALRKRGGLPVEECLELALQVASGLHAIHAAGIVHRDLTTPNVMLGADGVARILDFGIAKHANPEGATHPTAAGYVMGSPEYMSPEQAQGRPVDYRTDVYSFGVVLFEVATGNVPFRGETPVATLLMHIDAPPPLEAAALPPVLRPVLRRALAKDPRDRYATAGELLDALRSAGGGAADSHASPTDTAQHARRAFALTAIALGLGLAAGGVLLIRSNREPPPHSLGPRASEPPRPSPPVSPQPAPTSPPSTLSGSLPSSARPDVASSEPLAGRVAANPPALESGDSQTRPARPAPDPASPLPSDSSPRPAGAPSAAIPTPGPEAQALPANAEPVVQGALLVLVTPWANVAIDGVDVGQTPLARIPLTPGPHAVVLSHPDYQPFPRRVVIRPGETLRLTVALAVEGVRKRR